MEEPSCRSGTFFRTRDGTLLAWPRAPTLAEAARILAQHHIGAVVIQDSGGALAGIFSERDLVRAVAEDGALALGRAIAAYMSRQVTTCRKAIRWKI